jgi:hypothetical protein
MFKSGDGVFDFGKSNEIYHFPRHNSSIFRHKICKCKTVKLCCLHRLHFRLWYSIGNTEKEIFTFPSRPPTSILIYNRRQVFLIIYWTSIMNVIVTLTFMNSISRVLFMLFVYSYGLKFASYSIPVGNSMVSSAIWKKTMHEWVFQRLSKLAFEKLTSVCFSNCTRNHTILLINNIHGKSYAVTPKNS